MGYGSERYGVRVDIRRNLLLARVGGKLGTIQPCSSLARLEWVLAVARGERCPLRQLAFLLRCPRCGQLNVTVYFEVPNNPVAVAAWGKIDIEDYREEGG